jgi:hypothetical protein
VNGRHVFPRKAGTVIPAIVSTGRSFHVGTSLCTPGTVFRGGAREAHGRHCVRAAVGPARIQASGSSSTLPDVHGRGVHEVLKLRTSGGWVLSCLGVSRVAPRSIRQHPAGYSARLAASPATIGARAR